MNQAVIFSPADWQTFLSRLDEIVENRLKGYVVEKPITAKEAADYLNITEKTLWERFRTKKMPSKLIHRAGGSAHFFASELHQYIKSN